MSQNDHPEHGARTLIERIFAFMETTALMAAAKIGLPDALADGPLSPEEVAARLSVGEEAVALTSGSSCGRTCPDRPGRSTRCSGARSGRG